MKQHLSTLFRTAAIGLTGLAMACDPIEQAALRFMLEPSDVEPVAGVQVISDLVYSRTPQGDLLLDLHLPAEPGDARLPVVVFMYGGAFEMGNKHQLALYDVHTLPLEGIAVASINYRLSDQAIFPAQFEDALKAVDWIHANAAKYNLDETRIGVWGMSAGGMLAALIGTAVDGPLRVQAVVDYYGPTDFLQGDDHAPEGVTLGWRAAESWPSRYLGTAIAAAPDRVQATNPVTYVDAADPPFLIVHGDRDDVVPLHQSQLLYDALNRSGVTAELYVVKGGGHARGGEFGSPALHAKTVAFLKEHLESATAK